MQQVEAAHGQQQQFESRAPRGIFYNGTWYNTQAYNMQLPSCVLPETWQWQQQQQQQQYAHATLQPGLHLQQGLQLVVAEVTPQLPLQSSRSHYQICTCQRGQPLSMLHGLHFVQPHQCNNYEAVIKQQQQQQHLQQLTAQHIQTPLMPQFSQQFHQQLEQQQQPQHFIQQQLELTHLNQQPQCFYSTQVQGTDSPQQEIQQELTQQELQLQQQQQHFIQQQHSNQQQHFQQQLPQQQLHLELQQQQHFIQWQQNSNQCCYSTQVEVAQFAQREMQQQLPQQQLESQELQQHQQHTNQQEQQQCCYSTQFQQQQQLQQQLEHQTQSQQRLQQAQPQQQQLESQQLEQHQQDSNEQQQLEQCCYSTQVESPQKEMQQELPQQQLESQELQQHQQDSNEQPQQKDLEQYCYLTQVQDTQSPQQQKLEQQSPPEQQFQQQPHFVQEQLESEQLQQHQQQQCCYSTQLEQQLQQQLEHQTQSQQQLQQAQPQQQQLESEQLEQHQQQQCCHSTQLLQSHPQQQQQPLICQQHYLPDQTNNYRPQSSSTTPTSFPSSSSPSPSSISTPQPVNDPQIIQVDMSSVSKVHITRSFARLVISIYRQTEFDDESPNRVIINGQVLISDSSDSSNGQSMSQLHVNSATQTPTKEETQTETPMSTDASDEVDSSTADLEELLQYTTAAVATVNQNQSKSSAQTEPEQFRAPRRVAKQQPMLQHNPLKKAPKWTKPAIRISRELLNSSGSNETLPNRIQQENEQMPHENSEGILEKFELVNSETILKESSTNLQKVEQKQMQQEESGKVLQKIEQVQMPQKRSETIQQKIEQIPLPKKESTTNLHKIKEKEMLQEKIEKMPQKSLETNLQKIEQIPIQQKDSERILQKIDEVGVPQKEPRTNLNNIKEKQMTQKKPETILQKIEQMPLPQNESTTNVQKIEQILKEKSGRILQKIDQMPQEKPTTVKVQTIPVTAKLQDCDSNNSNNLFKQTTLGMASQQPQLALEICNHLGQQDRDLEEEWPDLSVQQTTPSVRIRKPQPSPSPQPVVNQKCNGMRSPPSFPEDYPIGEPKLPQSIYKQMYKRKSSQSKTIEQSTSMMTTKQETPLRSQSVDNVNRSWNTKTYQRINHNSDECPQLNGIRQILSPTRRNQSAQSYQSLVNQQKNLTRYQQGATKSITIKPTMNTLSKAQSITVHQSDVNQAAARNDQVVNQSKSSSNQVSIQSISSCVKAGNQKQKSTPKAMSKVKSEQQPNINQTVNLKSQSAPRFGLNESKTSKSITDLPKKKSNGAFESNANQATDAKESEVHQSINLSADNEKPVKTFECSESENQSEVSLNADQVVNQPKSSSNQASIQSTSTCVKAGNQKQKSTPKAMSKVKSEQQPNINQTVNLKSQSAPRFGLNESKTSKSITDLPKKKSNGAFESNANQATDAKESEVHQSINLSADNEKPVKTFACSESENQSEVSLNPEMDNDTKPSTSQNAEALGIRKTNNNRKQKTRMSKFERKALRRELQNVQLAARKSEENSQSTEEVLQPVEVQHDVEEVKRNQQSTEVDQHLKDIPQPMEWESSDEVKPKEEPKETEPSDEDPELNNPLLSGISCKIMRGHILRIAKKINSL
ncbi:uncharacterized protein LOC117578168 [Drosophila albomicans]|uniref:Uncharacterized protein LOC117578168 n=1 Tax=Drosophila albomicans TaxID=7291 RepID=A0A6P8Y0A2_DROAB|nr:uncharacterized protein LOC117578168 [Drosophila albomicans]